VSKGAGEQESRGAREQRGRGVGQGRRKESDPALPPLPKGGRTQSDPVRPPLPKGGKKPSDSVRPPLEKGGRTQSDPVRPPLPKGGRTQSDPARPPLKKGGRTQSDSARPPLKKGGRTQSDPARPPLKKGGRTQSDPARPPLEKGGRTQSDPPLPPLRKGGKKPSDPALPPLRKGEKKPSDPALLPLEKGGIDDPTSSEWQQGGLVEVTIADLTDEGDGVGRTLERVVFVPDTVVGDRILARLVRVKPQYAFGKLHQILEPSRSRIRPGCIVADKCGGCQWQHINYDYQLEAKRNQVIQALERIGGISSPPVDAVLAPNSPLGYRNKATYPLALSSTGVVQAGYYQKSSHHVINLNQCPVQDSRLNPLLANVKKDIENRGWQVYDENHHQGQVRHLGLRIGRRTGEILLTLVVKDWDLPGIEAQAQEWLKRYPNLVGVSLNRNPQRTNAIFGNETRCIAGKPDLEEEFANLKFHIRPDTFFQVNTEVAEALVYAIVDELNLQGDEMLVDAYCGIGTMTLPLAKQVRQAIGLDVQGEAIEQAKANAKLNGIDNINFLVGTVEKLLPELEVTPDIVLLDPPRKGCDRHVIDTLLQIKPQRIVYVSCKPATLARDLKLLCQDGEYRLTRVQPADFFPQTSHVECAAFLVRQQAIAL
jgi:23S rRNA (uracil1939-C5)-methyltransferase